MSIEYIFSKMIILFSILILGYVCNKIGFIDNQANKNLSSIVLNLALPLKMLSSLNESNCTKQDILTVLASIIAVHVLLIIIGKFVAKILKKDKNDSPILEFLIVFSNNGFMGYPVIESILGASALIYASIYDMFVSVIIFSYGVYLFQKSKNGTNKIEFKKMISTASVAGFLTMVLAFFGVKLPNVVCEVFLMVGDTASPLSMLVIGSSLAMIKIGQVFKGWRTYVFSVIRLLVVPAIVFLIFSPFITNQLILGVIVIVAAMPCAATTVMFAHQYDCNEEFASKYVFITTLLSVITIPIIGYLLFALHYLFK